LQYIEAFYRMTGLQEVVKFCPLLILGKLVEAVYPLTVPAMIESDA